MDPRLARCVKRGCKRNYDHSGYCVVRQRGERNTDSRRSIPCTVIMSEISQPPLTLEEKVAQAQADLQKWSQPAASPNLSPEAARAARSTAAALKLGQKALAWRDDPEKANKVHQRSLRSLNVPLPEALQPKQSPSASQSSGDLANIADDKRQKLRRGSRQSARPRPQRVNDNNRGSCKILWTS